MKIFVGNLGDEGSVTSEDLRPLFEAHGAVGECECIKNYAYVFNHHIPRLGGETKKLSFI